MGLFDKREEEDNSFEEWVLNASHEELSAAYEIERQKMIADRYKDSKNGRTTPIMDRLNDEIRKRVDEEWKNDPRRIPGAHWKDENRYD